MELPRTTTTQTTWWQALRLGDVALATIVVLSVASGFVLLLTLRNALVGVFFGLLLATALRPTMIWLSRSGVPRVVAAGGSVVALVGFVVALVAFVAPVFTTQLQALVHLLPSLYLEWRESLTESSYRLVRYAGTILPLTPRTDSALAVEALSAQVFAWMPWLGHGMFVLVSTLLFAYFWLLYRDRSIRGMLLLLASEQRAGVETIWLRIEERIGAYVRGQALLALTTAVLSLIGYWIAGVPYALLLALVAGVLEFVPYLGPLITAALAASLGFSVSPAVGLGALLVGILVTQLENLALVPRIMEKAVGVRPVVTLLAFVGFAALFGPLGGFLAIPLAATMQVLFSAWLDRQAGIAIETGRGVLDRLRYQTQELAQDVSAHMRTKEADDPDAGDAVEEELEALLLDLQRKLEEVDQFA
jgi:predicted PurR-regulated permease PerM